MPLALNTDVTVRDGGWLLGAGGTPALVWVSVVALLYSLGDKVGLTPAHSPALLSGVPAMPAGLPDSPSPPLLPLGLCGPVSAVGLASLRLPHCDILTPDTQLRFRSGL